MEQNTKKRINIPGTKLSVNNTQLLISSGIPSFDDIIGGGLAVGTVTLIEEDVTATYSKLILQYFLAEGVVSGHSAFVGSQEFNSSALINTLPAVIDTDDSSSVPISTGNDEKLTIAWRYQNIPTSQPKQVRKFGHFYDLTKTMDPSSIASADIKSWTYSEQSSTFSYAFVNPAYHDLLQSIKLTIDQGGFGLKSGSHRSILRVALQSIGSPLWLANDYKVSGSAQTRDLDMFLFCLRALIRNAFATVVVTIPSTIIDEASVNRCVHSSDTVIRLQAFAGTDLEHNKALSDYKGFFHVTKLSAINALCAKALGPVDFAFKLRRKKFAIEELHLPPELQDTSEREQDEIPSLSCGSAGRKLLEF
ncbi:uncharacterized protein CBL_07753 [Carabus blaptoides fortunei]